MKAFEAMQLHYRERDLSARKWKAAGGKVVGYTYTSVPEELIIAAGSLPMMITGNPEISTEAGDRYMEDYFCPFVRSVHNLFVTGNYDFVDLAVFPHTNDSIKRCYYYLWTEKRNEPGLPIPPLTIFDSLHTRKHIANRYVRGRIAAFKEKMEELSGRPITPEALLKAVEVCNENRRLLKQVAALRRSYPPRVSGVEALQIIGSAFFMHKEEHNALLRDFLADADKLPPKGGARLFLSGTIVDHPQIYELIESCGAVIVSEDICTGNRYSDNLVDTSMEPLDALTDRYHTKSHEGRMYPLSELVAYIVDCAKEAGARGVIFNYLRWDDSHGWNYPSQRDALANIDIPSIAFEMQEYKIRNQEQLRTRTEAFVEMIREGAYRAAAT